MATREYMAMAMEAEAVDDEDVVVHLGLPLNLYTSRKAAKALDQGKRPTARRRRTTRRKPTKNPPDAGGVGWYEYNPPSDDATTDDDAKEEEEEEEEEGSSSTTTTQHADSPATPTSPAPATTGGGGDSDRDVAIPSKNKTCYRLPDSYVEWILSWEPEPEAKSPEEAFKEILTMDEEDSGLSPEWIQQYRDLVLLTNETFMAVDEEISKFQAWVRGEYEHKGYVEVVKRMSPGGRRYM